MDQVVSSGEGDKGAASGRSDLASSKEVAGEVVAEEVVPEVAEAMKARTPIPQPIPYTEALNAAWKKANSELINYPR